MREVVLVRLSGITDVTLVEFISVLPKWVVGRRGSGLLHGALRLSLPSFLGL